MKQLLFLWLVLLIFTACAPEREVIGSIPTMPPSPTITPTATTTPVVQPTLIAELPTATPIPAATRPPMTVVVPTPAYLTTTPDFSGEVIGTEGAILREGASLFYPVVGAVGRGARLTVIGQSASGRWGAAHASR